MRVRTEEQMREGFVAGEWPWRPGPGFNSWAEPCWCGNDGTHCDELPDEDKARSTQPEEA